MTTALLGDPTAEYQTGIGCPGAPVTVTPSLMWSTVLVGDIWKTVRALVAGQDHGVA